MKYIISTLFLLVSGTAWAQTSTTSTTVVVDPSQISSGFTLIGEAVAAVMNHGWLALGAFLVPAALLVLNTRPLKAKLASDKPLDWLRPLIMAVVTAAAVIMGTLSEGVNEVGAIFSALGGAGVLGLIQKTIQEALD